MSRRIALLAAGLALGVAAPALAQNPGLPVYNTGVSTGLTLSGDVGFPNDAFGGGTAFGGSARLGFGPLGVSASVSSYKPDGGESATSVGGTLNWKAFGGPLIPVSVTLQAGASRTSQNNVTLWRYPVGVSLAVSIPTTVIGIRPWIAPRLEVNRISIGNNSDSQSDFGISGGVELNLLSGLGFHVAYDRLSMDGGSVSTFGVGAHYAIRIPGL